MHDSAAARPHEIALRIFPQWYVATLVAARRFSIPRIARPEIGIFISLDGAVLQFGDTESATTTALGAAVTAPMADHSLRATDGLYVSVVVSPNHPRFPSLRDFLAQPIKPLDPRRFAHLEPRFRALFCEHVDAATSLPLIDEVIEVVLQDAQPLKPVDERVRWVMSALQDDIDRPFDELAAQLQISCSRLSHLFSSALGLPFRSYQAWRRTIMAWEMVTRKPQMSLTQIAHLTGFSDSAHLSRKFQRNFGLTPTRLRNPRLVRVIESPPAAGKPRSLHCGAMHAHPHPL